MTTKTFDEIEKEIREAVILETCGDNSFTRAAELECELMTQSLKMMLSTLEVETMPKVHKDMLVEEWLRINKKIILEKAVYKQCLKEAINRIVSYEMKLEELRVKSEPITKNGASDEDI